MSDLNCGCDSCENRMGTRETCGCGCNNSYGCNSGSVFGGNNSCLWIILLLIFCGGCGSSGYDYGNGCGNSCGFGNNSCLWIILLLIFCGGCGNGSY